MNLSPVFRQRFFDLNGLPLAGGQVFTYQAGTTTPQITYSNATGTQNTNPVVLDSSGYADIWFDPTLAYKVVLQDANSNVLWTEDGITYAVGISAWSANSVYGQGALVTDSSGQGLIYVSLTSNNQNNALTNPSAWRVFGGNVRTLTANTTLSVTDDFIRSNSTAATLTIHPPPVATTPIGKRITIKDVGTGGNYTEVQGAGSDLIDGNNAYAEALLANQSRTFINNGTSWDVVGNVGSKQITTAMIANATITGTQLAAGAAVANIAAETLTQAMLQARATGTSVAAGGIAVSASCGAYNVTNLVGSGGVAVTNLSATIVTTGRPVFLALVPDGSANYAQIGTGTAEQSGGVGGLFLGVFRGSTLIGSHNFLFDTSSGLGAGLTAGSVLLAIDITGAGTYTYSVQASTGAGTSIMYYMKLIAFEL